MSQFFLTISGKEWRPFNFILIRGLINLQACRLSICKGSPPVCLAICLGEGAAISPLRDEREGTTPFVFVLWYPDHVCLELQEKAFRIGLGYPHIEDWYMEVKFRSL